MSLKHKDILMDEKQWLLNIAICINAAIQYQECALSSGHSIDDQWYEEGLGSELVSI
jgi:hypothetical protein